MPLNTLQILEAWIFNLFAVSFNPSGFTNKKSPSKLYTYIGIGHLENARKGVTKNGSILYDIHMDNPLPQELQEDFQWME